jgi:CRP/FNR family transcriptional regulator
MVEYDRCFQRSFSMITEEQFQRILSVMPVLEGADSDLAREFQGVAVFRRIRVGADVFVEGDRTEWIAFLLSGVVRVYKVGETGREITLYRFGHGESCILTANAILSQQSFPAIATVEEEAEAVMIPADSFRDWVRRYDLWREFVFDLFSKRLSTVMMIVDEVAFQRMDRRVASLLLERAEAQNPIQITHREIAADVGSSREVISRLLEDFAAEGIVSTGRGSIEILDFQTLEARSLM